jgi:hypothetical protein
MASANPAARADLMAVISRPSLPHRTTISNQ